MPPGTGDVQMGLARMLPRTSMVIVTTPALAAQKVAQRAADMAKRSFLPVVGVIENMSCVHVRPRRDLRAVRCRRRAGPGHRHRRPAARAGAARAGGGGRERRRRPVSLDGDGAAAQVFRSIAERISRELAPPVKTDQVDMAGCSARLLDAVNAAFDAQ